MSLTRLIQSRFVVLLLASAAMGAGVLTYIVVARSPNPFGPRADTIMALIAGNTIVLLALVAVVGRRVLALWREVRSGFAGSRLHTRMMVMFTVVAVVPAVLVSVFSAMFFNYGLKTWFDQRVSAALQDSLAVAEAYYAEHREVLKADALAMANDLNHEASLLYSQPQAFNNLVAGQAALRSLTEAIVFQHNRIVASTALSFSLAFEKLPVDAFKVAETGEVAIVTSEQDDRVRAIVKLDEMTDTYLLIGRFVDAKVMKYMESTQGAVSEYLRLKNEAATLQMRFFTVFGLVALVILLAAVWYGMAFASDMVRPLGALIAAAERVRGGDYQVQVPTEARQGKNDEIASLVNSFNKMTTHIDRQREELIDANRQLDTRRRLIEAVLEGVSAGVISVGRDGMVALCNPSALQLLALGADAPIGTPLAELLPDVALLLEDARRKPEQAVQRDMTVTVQNQPRTFHIRLAAERVAQEITGFILTFDDVTELVVAQRTAAWADVARRVAHEIKNPLTPITLSAERLRKKYLPETEAEREPFNRYLDTILRNISDIGRIVEEFVSFARMPAPKLDTVDVRTIANQAVFSEKDARGTVAYHLELPEKPMKVLADERLIGQVLTNLLKNAAEAFEGIQEPAAQIWLTVTQEDEMCAVCVRDNGRGFPADLMARLTEPYVTTRAKGTGLGLAIVKKIVEDHRGRLTLANHPDGGAVVKFTLPLA